MATDPVCGMTVSPDSRYRHVHGGQTYLFCSAKCLTKFQASPADYIDTHPAQHRRCRKRRSDLHLPDAPGDSTTSPGNCPKCGMTLEPVEPATTQSSAIEYTCPMHPEVVRNEPGSCPKCGMALEPRNAPAEDNTELNDMTRRFWVSAALALPVFLMAMVSDLAPQLDAGFCFDDRAAMAGIRAGHAGGAVGRLADLPARLGIAWSTAASTCSA